MPARRSANLLWLLAVVAGTALRLYQLRDQVLVDDEWHALHLSWKRGPMSFCQSGQSRWSLTSGRALVHPTIETAMAIATARLCFIT